MPNGQPTASRRTVVRDRRSHVTFEGLRDFLTDLGVMDRELDRAEMVFKTLAASTVVARSKQLAHRVGRQQARASQDVQVAGPGAVVYGGLPWSFGAEFGSYVYGQFPTWRGNKDDAGYFFWPAIREFRDEKMLELWVREVWAQVENLFSG